MTRRRGLRRPLRGIFAGLLLFAMPIVVEAQPPGAPSGRTPVVGVLLAELPSLYLPEFTRALADLGWVDGKTVRLEARWAEGRHDRLPVLAGELVRLKVDVIVALNGTPPALATKQATTTIPVVFTTGGDPVAFGIVSSLARTEGNLTGVGAGVPLVPKRVQLLVETVPKARQVAYLANAQNPIHGVLLKAHEHAARQLGLVLHQVLVSSSGEEIDAAFSTMAKQRIDALVVQGDAFFVKERARLIRLAARARLPTAYSNSLYVEAGGLMSFAADFADLSRRAAALTDRLLRGAKPGDLPVEQATTFDLAINLKTARALGLTIPPALLLRANRVIE